jgi:hypothetical protein
VVDGASGTEAGSSLPKCATPAAASGPVQKVSHLELAFDVTGCDRNGDGVADNALGTGLGKMGGQVNQRLADNLATGKLLMLLAADDFRTDGKPFALSLLTGALSPVNLGCPLTSATADCSYDVLPSSFDANSPLAMCPPRNLFAQATIHDGLLHT